MTRGQRTEDRRQILVRATRGQLDGRGEAAIKTQSSALSPDKTTSHSTKRANNARQVAGYQSSERGFSLVTAIFLLVVLAGLGAAMMTFFTAQQQSSALDVMGTRAYQASRAGIEWGAYQIMQNSGVGFAPACRTGATQSPVALEGTLSSFSVSVACSATSHTEAVATLWVYQLTSTASGVQGATPGSPDYIERQMQAAIAQ